MGNITANTELGKKRKARKELEGAKVQTALQRLDEIIQEMNNSPTVAQRTQATKDMARMLKHIIRNIT